MDDFYTTFVREGTHVAVNYDHHCESPFSWGWDGLAISPYGRNSADYGEDIWDELATWDEDRERLVMLVEDTYNDFIREHEDYTDTRARLGWKTTDDDEREHFERVVDTSDALAAALDVLRDHDTNRPDYVVFEWCPYVDIRRYFRVAYSPSTVRENWGLSEGDNVHDFVVGLVETFNVWYRGGVFFIETATVDPDDEDAPGDVLDSLCGVMFSVEYPGDDEIWEYVQHEMITAKDKGN